MQTWWKMLLVIGMVGGISLGLGGCSGGGGGIFGIDQSTEVQLGHQSSAQIEQQYGVVNDPVESPRVARIGARIASVTQRPNLPWSYKIINMKDVNAFSLPGGPVYVTRGLMNLGLSDDELAGVLGHESAHINQRHVVKQLQQQEQTQFLAQLALGGSSQVTQAAVNAALQIGVYLPHSRGDENEADNIGMRFAYNAGYNPYGLVHFLQRLQQVDGGGGGPTWLQDHPSTPDRIARTSQEAAALVTEPRPVPVVLEDQSERETIKDALSEKAKQEELLLPADAPVGAK